MNRILSGAGIIGVIAIGFAAPPAQAATLGEALALPEEIAAEADRRCPESANSEDSLTAMKAVECRMVTMRSSALVLRMMNVADRLMQECIAEVRAGGDVKDCDADDANYRAVVLTGKDEEAYTSLRDFFESWKEKWPVLR